jgi:hypothetical protein
VALRPDLTMIVTFTYSATMIMAVMSRYAARAHKQR